MLEDIYMVLGISAVVLFAAVVICRIVTENKWKSRVHELELSLGQKDGEIRALQLLSEQKDKVYEDSLRNVSEQQEKHVQDVIARMTAESEKILKDRQKELGDGAAAS